jgi:putative Mn2+ efflux pump MntP
MTLPELLLIAIALGADAFSVAVGVGAARTDWPARARLAAAFGLFQFAMPVVGWNLGAVVLQYVQAYDHWVAFSVLVAISLHMLWESFRPGRESGGSAADPTRGALLLGLAVATSIDALAVGFTMGHLDARRWAYAGLIGVVAALMTLGGMILGHRGSRHLGEWAERAGALLMLAVAVRMLVM